MERKICELENEVEKLKYQLGNCIVPKFEIGQKVFLILGDVVKETNISGITIFVGDELSYYCKDVNNERMYLELRGEKDE